MLCRSACTRRGNSNANAVLVQQVRSSIAEPLLSTGIAVGVLHASALARDAACSGHAWGKVAACHIFIRRQLPRCMAVH